MNRNGFKPSVLSVVSAVRTYSDITAGTSNLNALASIFMYSECTSEYFQQIRRSQSPLDKHYHPAHVFASLSIIINIIITIYDKHYNPVHVFSSWPHSNQFLDLTPSEGSYDQMPNWFCLELFHELST